MNLQLVDDELPALPRDTFGLDALGLTNVNDIRDVIKGAGLTRRTSHQLPRRAPLPSEAHLAGASAAQRAQASAAAAKELERQKQLDSQDYSKYELLKPAKIFPDVNTWRGRLIVPLDTPENHKTRLRAYVQHYIAVLEQVGRDSTPFPIADKNLAFYLAELTRLAELIDSIYDVLEMNRTHLAFALANVAWLAAEFNGNLSFHGAFALASRRLLRLYYEQQPERPSKLCRVWWLLLCRLRYIGGRMATEYPDEDMKPFARISNDIYTRTPVRDYFVGANVMLAAQCSILLRCDYEFFGINSVDPMEGDLLGSRPCDANRAAATLAEEARQVTGLSRDRAQDSTRLPAAALHELGDGILEKPVSALRVREVLHLLTRIHCYWRDVVWGAQVEMLILQLWRHLNRFLFDPSDATQALMSGQSMYVRRETVVLEAPEPAREPVGGLGLEFDTPPPPRNQKTLTVYRLNEHAMDIGESKLPHHLWAIQHKWRYSVMVYCHAGWAPHQYFPAGLIDGVSRGSIDTDDTYVQVSECAHPQDATSAMLARSANRKGATVPCALSDIDMPGVYSALQKHVYTGDAAQRGTRHELRTNAYRAYLRPGEHCQFRQENPVLNRAPIDVLRAFRTKDEFTQFASFVQLDRVVDLALAAAFNQLIDTDLASASATHDNATALSFINPKPEEMPYLSQAPALEGHVIFTLLRLHYLASAAAAGNGRGDAYCREVRSVLHDLVRGTDLSVASALKKVDREHRRFTDARYSAGTAAASRSKRTKTSEMRASKSDPLLTKDTIAAAVAAGASNDTLVTQDAYYERIGLPPGIIRVDSPHPQLVYIRGEYWVMHLPHAMLITRNAVAALAAYVRRCAYIAPTCYNLLLPPGLIDAFARHAELAANMRLAT